MSIGIRVFESSAIKLRMKITTRPPVDSDKEFVRNVHHAGYRDVVVSQFGSWDKVQQDRFFEMKWANANLAILEVDGINCGYVTVEDRVSEVHLVELVVHPEFQGRGIGSSFIQRLIERATKRSVAIRLQVLLNNRAIELYRRLGFQRLRQNGKRNVFDGTIRHLRSSVSGSSLVAHCQCLCRPGGTQRW